jgi:uncharacterized protein (TIGR02271 family)
MDERPETTKRKAIMTGSHATVVGVFEARARADQAVEELQRAGFRDDQVGVAQQAPAGEGGKAATGKGRDAGFLESVGGFFKKLFGSAEEAGEYHAGRAVVTVKADGRSEEAWSILRRHGAYNRANPPAASGAEAGRTVQLREEELRARKQEVETGEVRVRKEVVTETKTLEVPVQREEVVIERRPAGQGAGTAGVGTAARHGVSAADLRPGEKIRIPVKEEKVHVKKEAVVKEEVTVGKREVQGTEQVAGTVRKEELRVEKEGNVEVRGNADDKGRKRKRK